MPVPKRKTSKSRRDMRQSTKFIRPKIVATCNQCEEPTLPHQVCVSCGHYKGRKVLTTKNDRGMQRMQVRAALAEKQAKKKSSHDDHSHDDGHDHSHE